MGFDFSLSDEHLMVKKTVADMLKKFEPKREELKQMVLVDKIFPQELWDSIADAGFLGCLIPEEYGGTDMGLLALTIGVEAMSMGGYGNGMLILTAMDSACILRNGTEELKQRFLPRIANGELKLCFGLTEPNAGSNTFRLETTARLEGDRYILNGQKIFITGVDVADYMLVVARSMSIPDCEANGFPKAYGLSLFMIDTKAKGLTKKAIPTRGIEGLTQWEVFFDDCEVPVADLVGQEHAGSMALFNSLNPERILAAAMGCGITDYLIKKSVAYANDRKVFKGRPIGAYQAIQHPLAELKIELEATRLLTYRSAWSYDQKEEPGVVGMWANMAKYKAAELSIDAADRAIQTHGGYGFSEEYEVIYYWEGTRLMRTAPISKEMILNYVSSLIGLPRSY